MKVTRYAMRNLRYILTLLLLAVLVAASDYGEAATPVTIALTGPSTYSITATDLPESSGMELSISYDVSTLESPQVKSGTLTASAMMDQNISTPGQIRIVFISSGAIKGTGELARISFTLKAGAQAKLKSFTASVYSQSYTQVPVTVTPIIDVNAAGSSAAQSGSDNSATSGTTTGATTGVTTGATAGATTGTTAGALTPVYTGSIRFPDTQQQQEQKSESKKPENSSDSQTESLQQYSQPPSSESNETASSVVTSDISKKTVSPGIKLHSIKGVLARFRDYQGQRTLKGFTPLFEESEGKATGIVQRPALIVSDGKSLVTVTVALPPESDSPVFSLKGANQKAVRRISENKWELDALPQKGKIDVRLSIILKGERIEVPLAVVPPLNPVETGLAALSAAALDTLLAKPLKNNKPAYDVNSDGIQDYLDDYILVAHWLLKQQSGVNKGGNKPIAVGK